MSPVVLGMDMLSNKWIPSHISLRWCILYHVPWRMLASSLNHTISGVRACSSTILFFVVPPCLGKPHKRPPRRSHTPVTSSFYLELLIPHIRALPHTQTNSASSHWRQHSNPFQCHARNHLPFHIGTEMKFNDSLTLLFLYMVKHVALYSYFPP